MENKRTSWTVGTNPVMTITVITAPLDDDTEASLCERHEAMVATAKGGEVPQFQE